MKFRNYLQTIDGVAIYPLIGLLIFAGIFVGLVWYLVRMDKKTVQKISHLPLEDGTIRRGIATVLLFFVASFAFAQEEAPKAGDKELVNYRSKAPYFVVDKLFKQAILELGVGSQQQQVTLTNNA